MNSFQRGFVWLGIAIFIFPQIVSADTVIRGAELVSVDAEQTLKGDFYAFGSGITLSGTAEHDAYLGAGTVTVNGPVGADLTVLGGSVQIHSDIADDVRVLGAETVIGGTVEGDVVMLGGTLTILSTATIKGDVIFFGGSLVVEGAVLGSLNGYAETVRVNASIGGDIDMTAQVSLTLSDKASVAGSVTYESLKDLSRAQNAVVEGEIVRNQTAVDEGRIFDGILLFGLMLLFMAAALFVVARSQMESYARESFERVGQNGLIGLAFFLLMPMTGMVLLLSVVGAPVGVLALGVSISMYALAFGMVPMFAGYALQRFLFTRHALSLTTLLLGVFAVLGVLLIPVVGPFIVFALSVVSMGTVTARFVRSLRN